MVGFALVCEVGVQIELRCSGGSLNARLAKTPIVTACVMLAVLVAFLVLLPSCSLVTSPPKTNVVLIIVDTLKPDRLGCYNYPIPTSPNIDNLASESALFENVITCSPVTLPSVSAILTSTYPIHNNVRYNGMFFLSDSFTTLGETLKENGYKTAAFVGGFPLDSRFKVDQGFDIYDDDFSNSAKQGKRKWIGHKAEDFERSATEVNERAFRWLEEVKDEQFFLMVHYFDPHWPYDPPEPYATEFQSPYDGEVAYTDKQVGKLLEKLGELGLMKNTLIVFTGDHGEGLGAHKELTHGQFIFDTTMKIPLILYHHKHIPKGRRINTMVKSIDIMPTILEFLGISVSHHTQGVSLLPAFDKKLKESPALLETMLPYYESEDLGDIPVKIMGLRTGEWKLVQVELLEEGRHGWIGQLYNVKKDPLEVFNVREGNQETYMRLLEEMKSIIETSEVEADAGKNIMEMDAETRQKLKSLGYLK